MRYNHFDMLPERAFLKVGGRITLEGGGSGGGGNQQSTQTAYQTNIPAYLEDPAKRMVSRGETLSEQGYQPYTGERVAGFAPMQQAAFQEIGGLTTPEEFAGSGSAITGAQRFGTAGALGAMGYGSQALTPDQLTYFQMAQPGTFGTEQAQQYMSPYQQAVTDVAKREAATEAAMLNRELGSKAAKAGAFGGSRFGIEQALLGSKLATNLSDIQTKGLQSAYENAQAQFERDRAAGMQAGQQNLQAALGVQSLGAQQSLEAQKANEANRLAAAQFNLQGAQFGADTGLKSAAQLQNLGTAEQDAVLKRIAAQQSAGAQQQALEQQKLDAAYQQYQEQRDWEKNQLGFLSGLIRGTPFSTSQLQTTSAPGATTASQVASLGLGAYGLSSLLGKKDGGAIKMAGGGSVEGYAYGGDVSGLPDQLLQAVLAGKSDDVPVDVAKQELARRAKLRTAVQGVRAEEQLASGIGGLEADNMEFADGGIVGYDEGGSVLSRWWDRVNAGTDDYVKRENERARLGTKGGWLGLLANQSDEDYAAAKKEREDLSGAPQQKDIKASTTPATSAPAAPTAPAARVAPAAPRATRNVEPPVAAAPAAPKIDPMQQRIYDQMEAARQSNAAMAEEIAKGQKDVDAIRGDIKGIAALRAAAALSQGGPGGFIGQLGRGLGAAGEEAQRGVNLMQSARQGLMGQRIQLAQLERQAAQGDVNALVALREMQAKEPLIGAQTKQALAYADYLKDKGGALGTSGGVTPKLQATIMAQVDKAGKEYAAANPGISANALQVWKNQEYQRRISTLGGGSMGGGDDFVSAPKGVTVRE